MSEKLEPLNFNLIARPFDPETKTAGGILIPELSVARPDKSTVVAVSKRLQGVEFEPQVGDVIRTVKGSGTPIGLDGNGKELYLFRNTDCLSR